MTKTVTPFTIASFKEAEEILRKDDFGGHKHVVSIGDPGQKWPFGLRRKGIRRLRLEFEDATYEYEFDIRATHDDIERLIKFLEPVREKILFHCQAGISRSSAAACILATMQLGPGNEQEALRHVLKTKDDVSPNKHVLRLADQILGRQGALLHAALDIWEISPLSPSRKAELLQALNEGMEPKKSDL